MTKRFFGRVLLSAITALLAAASAIAQPGQGPGRGMGMGPMHYDKSTEVTVKGTVEAVLTQQGSMPNMPNMPMHMGGGTHLTLKTDAGNVDVALGPTNWLAEKKYVFAKGDEIEVIGSSTSMNGQKTIVAREVTKGGSKMTLRDANGVPAWSGRGRQR
jgi:DNA/RNA endonuclease YhcR with UshA esterase domain